MLVWCPGSLIIFITVENKVVNYDRLMSVTLKVGEPGIYNYIYLRRVLDVEVELLVKPLSRWNINRVS